MTELPRSAEIVIVGGGAMGCSLAYHLASRGRRPLLLEGATLGGGSTGRCSGGVRQQFATEINVRLGMRSVALLRRFREEVGTDPGYRPIGYLLLATTSALARFLAANVAMQRGVGLEVDVVDPSEAARLAPGLTVDDVRAAAFCATDGVAGPHEITLGYAEAARRRGADLLETTPVTAIQVEGGAIRGVATAAGDVATPCVVNCAGPQAALVGALAGARVDVTPIRRQLFQLAGPEEWGAGVPMTVDLGTTLHFHGEGDGLLFGLDDAGAAPAGTMQVSWDVLDRLIDLAAHRLPRALDATLRTAWAGLYEMTPDRQPFVGPAVGPEGLWLACGFSGHGFMLSLAVGESLAATMCGEPAAIDLGAFAPAREAATGAIREQLVF
ncbi:MAG TPA: FAD-binding oxidoreductase [Candidatus Micrarchaeia archaeon]|nr:FAD-binding oxidoreductase [Candidatus Micrarchaeia archaeon]